MSGNDESTSRYFSDSLQYTNVILDSGATWHMTPQVSNFILGLLEDTDRNIEVADGHHVMAKQKEQVWIKICDDNIDNFVAILHNILLAPDLYYRSFYIITLMDLVYTCSPPAKFFALYTSETKRKMQLLRHIVHNGNIHFGENQKNVKNKEIST